MRRRQFLATTTAAATAATAGCLETVGLKQERETDLDWTWDAYPADTDRGYMVFVLGDLENIGDGDIHELEFTATLIDDADQQAEERTITITDLGAGTTQSFNFRIGTSRSIATGDLAEVEFETTILDAESAIQLPF